MTDGFGNITWWGFSPAIDLLDSELVEALEKLKLETSESPETLNILLVGAGDLRHVLTTVARSYRHPKRKLHFYLLENTLELYCRDMLLLSLALETPTRMGLQEKTELYMELFGNLLIRKQSTEYIQKMSNEFIKMVTDFDYLEEKIPVLDLSQLKFKERDFLEAIFKFWRDPDTKTFDAETCWDLRQRQYLGTRYDSRVNAYDWDYHMRLVEREADIIHRHEYKNWRTNGVAFEPREASYDTPNKTLASGMVFKKDGERHARRGYWGDILVSPYISMGIQCEERSFFVKSNKQYTKLSMNVMEYNLLSIFHEIATKTKYVPPKTDENPKSKEDNKPQQATITEITEEDETNLEEFEKKLEEEAAKQEDVSPPDPLEAKYESLPLKDVKVTFLPLNCLNDLPKKGKYKSLFHTVFFANSLVHNLTSELVPILAEKSTVIIESARYMIELKDEKVAEYAKKVIGMAQSAGCQVSGDVNHEKDNFFTFSYERLKT